MQKQKGLPVPQSEKLTGQNTRIYKGDFYESSRN